MQSGSTSALGAEGCKFKSYLPELFYTEKDMMYHCEFPYCNYTTDERSQITSHHIQAKSDGGSNKRKNRIYLCPSCHTKVYIPKSKHGIHSKFGKNSIIILGWLYSTDGRILHYKDSQGEKYYQTYNS